jgi:hypothetical protein
MRIRYWWESQMERDHWEDRDVGGVDNMKMYLREIGLIWVRIGTSGGLV